MRGLIYREIYLSRKSYITGVFVTAAVAVVGILVRLSTVCGNLAKLDGDSFFITDVYTYNIFMYLPITAAMCSLMNDGGVIVSDAKCHWNVYSYALPVSEIKLAAVKYIILIVSLLASFVLGILNAVIICGISGKEFSADIMKIFMIIAAVITFYTSLCIPLLIRFKTSAATGIFGTAAIGCVAVIFGAGGGRLRQWVGQFANADGEYDMDILIDRITEKAVYFRDILAFYAPFVIIGSLALGFAAAVMLYKRRVR